MHNSIAESNAEHAASQKIYNDFIASGRKVKTDTKQVKRAYIKGTINKKTARVLMFNPNFKGCSDLEKVRGSLELHGKLTRQELHLVTGVCVDSVSRKTGELIKLGLVTRRKVGGVGGEVTFTWIDK